MGLCEPRPKGCDDDCPGVCGCDGKFYCNSCYAQSAGMDVSPGTTCAAPDDFAAGFYFGGLDRLILRKVDLARDLCIRIVFVTPPSQGGVFNISLPEDWGVSDAWITNSAADCEASPETPPGESAQATGGSGMVSWTTGSSMYVPCRVGIDATLIFSGAPSWAPASVPLSAAGIVVEGGCQ
ncbi:uncharacterized protein CMC5_034190 [Chondromyces crocatus]|uniref:Kazal-like domain-containing protein n=2 Tax=Chondromyces crocatus TaxID=52 RepID=A0A0K1EEH5_CHOCO|nr:uncharacterized protein CMC5_034190 [Chondromyces crocatus]